MTKVLSTLPLLVFLSACATKHDRCVAERVAIVEENARLEARKLELSRYQAGEKIPRQEVSVVPREHLLAALIYNYNKAVGRLESRAAVFNRNCAS